MNSRFALACRAVARRRLVLLLLLLLVLETAHAAPNEQQEIQALYRRGLAGDKEAVVRCIDKLEAVLQTRPLDQFARVYLGSSYTLRSRDLGFGPKKLEALKHGLALMDEAIAAAPDDVKVRLVRALTTESLPRIFGRHRESRRDFALLASLAKTDPSKFMEADLRIIREHAVPMSAP